MRILMLVAAGPLLLPQGVCIFQLFPPSEREPLCECCHDEPNSREEDSQPPCIIQIDLQNLPPTLQLDVEPICIGRLLEAIKVVPGEISAVSTPFEFREHGPPLYVRHCALLM